MKLKDEVFEIYMDGKLLNEVTGYKSLEDELNDIERKLSYEGYKELERLSGSFVIYVNYKEQKCCFVAWKEWIGLVDVNGNRIYDGDTLVDNKDESVEIIGHWETGKEHEYTLVKRDGLRKIYAIEIEDELILKQMGIHKVTDTFEHFC